MHYTAAISVVLVAAIWPCSALYRQQLKTTESYTGSQAAIKRENKDCFGGQTDTKFEGSSRAIISEEGINLRRRSYSNEDDRRNISDCKTEKSQKLDTAPTSVDPVEMMDYRCSMFGDDKAGEICVLSSL